MEASGLGGLSNLTGPPHFGQNLTTFPLTVIDLGRLVMWLQSMQIHNGSHGGIFLPRLCFQQP